MEKPHRRRHSKEYMAIYREENREDINGKTRDWKAADPDRQRNAKLKERYGITLLEYNAMLEAQEGGCAICGAKESGRKGSTRLLVDHCHNSKKVRGLLCHKCNIAIGAFNDSLASLKRAVHYLGGSND